MSVIDNKAALPSTAFVNYKQQDPGSQDAVDARGRDLNAAARQAANSALGVISAADLLAENTPGATQAAANQFSATFKAGVPQLAPPSASVQASKDELGTAGWEAFILATLRELGVKVSVTTEEELSALQATVQARADERRAAHDDYAEKVAKAEEAQKTMGWISKLLGAVLTVVGVVGAAFTGGASLVLAVVGAGLFAADEVTQAVTGKSFMAEAMKPIMDAIGPIIADIAKYLAKDLVKLGVSEEAAAIASNVVVMVLAVAVIMAAMVAVKAAVPVEKIAAFLAKGIGKAVPNVLKELGAKGMAQLAQAVAPFKALMARAGNPLAIGNRIQTGAYVGGALNSGLQGASQVLTGIVEYDGKKLDARFADDPFIRDALARAITKAAEAMRENLDIEAKAQEMITNTIQSTASANLSIVRSLSM